MGMVASATEAISMRQLISIGITFLLLAGVADAGRITLKVIKETKGRVLLDSTARFFKDRVSLTAMRSAVGSAKDRAMKRGRLIVGPTFRALTSRTAGKIASGTVLGSIGAGLGVAFGALEGALDSVGLGGAQHKTEIKRVSVPLRDVRIRVPHYELEERTDRDMQRSDPRMRREQDYRAALEIAKDFPSLFEDEHLIKPPSKEKPAKRSQRSLLGRLGLRRTDKTIKTTIEPTTPLTVEVPVEVPQNGAGRDTVFWALVAGTLGYFGLTPDRLPMVGEHALWLMNHIDPRLLVEHGLDWLVPSVKAGAVGAAFHVAAVTALRAIKGGIKLGYLGAQGGAAVAEEIADRIGVRRWKRH
jgi:hypothetical protein